MAVTLLAAGCGSSQSSATPPAAAPAKAGTAVTSVKLATSSDSMTAGPVLAALSLNTFAGHGLQTKEVPFTGSSTNALAALLSGQTQFAFLGGTDVIDARAKGAPLVVIGPTATSLLTMALSSNAVAQLGKQGITPTSSIAARVKALKGMTIATSPPGSLSSVLLDALLKQYGLAPSDVKIVPSQPTAMLAGIKQGLYDGVFWPVGVMESAYADGSADLWISFPRGDVPAIPNFMQGVVATTESEISKQPQVVSEFRQSLVDAGTKITSDSAAAKAAVKSYAFPSESQAVFDQQWNIASKAWTLTFNVPRALFDSSMQVQKMTSTGNYSSITYSTLVYKGAQS